MRNIWIAALLFSIISLCADQLTAQSDWARFRGPNGTGVVADANLPAQWKEPSWQITLAGTGTSSPVAWQDRIFVTSCDKNTAKISLECLSLKDGQRLWIKSFESKTYKLHRNNSYASSTPAVDKDHVYLLVADTATTRLIALDHTGEKVWSRDFGSFSSSHGFGTSPMLFEDLVVFFHSQSAEQLPPGQQPGQSQMVAVNRLTGTDVWTTDFKTKRVCYGVPSVWTNQKGEPQLVNCNTRDGFFGVAPKTGEQLWSALPFKMRVVASPLVVDDMVIGSCGSGGGGNYLIAYRPEAPTEDKPQPAYRVRNSNYVPCPIAVNGLLFVFSDKGIAICVDVKTGKKHWQERLAKRFSSSPVADKNHVYAVDEDGVVHVIKATKSYEKVSEYDLGTPTRATPMIMNGQLFFRAQSKLICIGPTQKLEPSVDDAN